MMTTLLKDSLGGNCRTAMVANISGDPAQLEESLSTCRFAQAVACIANQVSSGVLGVGLLVRVNMDSRSQTVSHYFCWADRSVLHTTTASNLSTLPHRAAFGMQTA
jgi:hypothetical protein